MSMIFSAVAVLIVAQTANAHVSPFAKGMYCLNGVNGGDINAYEAVNPVYQMSYNDYWMHANTGCLNAPPAPGVFLELPAGGSFTVEYASNQAFTSLSYGGAKAGLWPDGADHDDLTADRQECVITPNLHAQNQSMAAGTAFAISYTSDISQVNEDNLVVFTVLEKSPWYREATYQVPAEMPACPEGGCICAWGWVPYHCGIPNIYMHPYRCMVTGATGTTAVGQPKSPEWCEDDPSKCVSGPKKFIIWNQLEGNTVSVSGYDLHGQEKSPGYNTRMGFYNGAQNDIFTGGASDPSYSAPSGGKSSDTPSSDDSSSSSGSSDNSSSSSPPADTSSIPEAGIPSNPAADAASAVVDSSPSIPSSVTTSSSATDASGTVCRRRRRSLSKRTENLVANHAHRRHIYNSW